MRKLFIVLTSIAAIVAMPILGQSIPRSYELQCAFDDGSRIAFKQHYTWDVLAAMIPADVTSKKYTGYDVRFISKKGQKSDWLEIRNNHNDAFVNVYDTSDVMAAQRLCSYQSMSPDDQYCYESMCVSKKGQWKEAEKHADDKVVSEPIRLIKLQNEKAYKDQLEKLNLESGAGVFRKIGSAYFYEDYLVTYQALTQNRTHYLDRDSRPIQAVYQSVSVDGGKTWSAPIITAKARIFELGKSMNQQSFIAKPYTSNGKKFQQQTK
jgi:hypothetical protein